MTDHEATGCPTYIPSYIYMNMINGVGDQFERNRSFGSCRDRAGNFQERKKGEERPGSRNDEMIVRLQSVNLLSFLVFIYL